MKNIYKQKNINIVTLIQIGMLILITLKRTSKRNALILLSVGMFVIASSQIISRFIDLPDLAIGLFNGIGIGLLILSVTFGNFKTVQ